jgi:hypothetical protein
MQRTNTTTTTLFTLPPSASATFNFSTPNNIRITIPETSTWWVPSHWHSPDKENCLLLHTGSGEFQVSFHKQPRTGGVVLGPGHYKFKPGYWTGWSRKQGSPRETVVNLVVESEGLERNICSAVHDAEIFPYLAATPFWLRGIFATLILLRVARRRLVRKICYVQPQVIYREHGYWEYHGGTNALSWWQWTHPFDVGRHPAWAVSVRYRSQKLFSRLVQGFYYRIGTALLGMRGDYPEYNPDFEDALNIKHS